MFRDFVLGSPAPARNPFCPAGGVVCPILPASNPENTYTLGLAYTLPLPEAAGQVTLNADYYHQSGVTSVDADNRGVAVFVTVSRTYQLEPRLYGLRVRYNFR